MEKKTPFPFLESSNAETIKLIHTDILGDDSPKFKHLNIKTVLNMEPNGSSEYIAWTEKKRVNPPPEILSELKPECNDELYRLIAKKNWTKINTLFPYLKPETRQLAEEWYDLIVDQDKLAEDALAEAKEILLKFNDEQKKYEVPKEKTDQKENKVQKLTVKYENLEAEQARKSSLASPPSYADITVKRLVPRDPNALPKVADISPQNEAVKQRELFNSKSYRFDQIASEGTKRSEEQISCSSEDSWVMVEKNNGDIETVSPVKIQTMKLSEANKKNRTVVTLERNIFEDDGISKRDKEQASDGIYSQKSVRNSGRTDYFPSLPSLIRGEANRQEKSQEVKEPAALNSAPSTRTYGMPKEEAEEPPVRSGPIYHMKEGFKSMISSLTGSGGSSTREKEEKPRVTVPSYRTPKQMVASSGLDLINSNYGRESPMNASPSVATRPLPPSPPPPPVTWLTEQDLSIGDVDPKNVFNILLLGETGVGKTTFINSFANYVKYDSMDEALEETPVILMKSSFSMTTIKTKDEQMIMKQKLITVEANCDKGKKNSENEQFTEGGRSRTQEPLLHCIKWEENGATKMLRIIDTPGVNDTRGASQDEANFGKILDLVRQIGNLSAICILLKPNESKLSMGFRNCLDNVLIKLHRSATKNILFCFTNTRSTLYRPGDTIAVLGHYLEELEKTAGVMIKANKSNIFCFDNDCFRYMCTLIKLPLARGENTHQTLSAGWVHNVEECKKLLDKIQGLLAHQVEDTVNINNTRRLLVALARPLTEIAQNQIVNKRMMETKIKEIQKLKEKGAQLGSVMEQKQIVIYKRKLAQPRTICTNSRCNDMIQESDGQFYPVPKKICHDNCFMNTITPLTIGDPSLQKCAFFNDKTGICITCKCHWKVHMHMTYELVRKEETTATEEDKNQFHACKNDEQRAEMVLEYLKIKLANIQSEYALIKEATFEFSAFLKFSSVKAGVDPYFDYLNHLIEVEENKAKHGGNKLLVIDLKVMLKEYNKGVAYNMEELKEGRKPPLTSDELRRKIENLSKMKLSGSLIADIVKETSNEQQ